MIFIILPDAIRHQTAKLLKKKKKKKVQEKTNNKFSYIE